MTPEVWLFLGTVITAAVSAASGRALARAARETSRRQARTDATKVDVDKSRADVENLRSIIESQHEYIGRLEHQRDECHAYSAMLEAQLRRLRGPDG